MVQCVVIVCYVTTVHANTLVLTDTRFSRLAMERTGQDGQLHAHFMCPNGQALVLALPLFCLQTDFSSISYWIALSDLTLLVGRQEGHRPVKTEWWGTGMVSCLERCKWFTFGSADATATPSSLAPVKSRMVYLSGAGLPRCPRKRPLNGYSSSSSS